MATYLSNAFALSMLSRTGPLRSPRPIDMGTAKELLDEGFVSIVGHADTAVLIAGILDVSLSANRISIQLGEDDHLVVAQYVGPRLPEGTKVLPEGSSFEFWLI